MLVAVVFVCFNAKSVNAHKNVITMVVCIVNTCALLFLLQQASELTAVFKDSSPTTPLIFVLSAGTDPAVDLYKFAEEMRFSKKLTAISLGQGQVSHCERKAVMGKAGPKGPA